LVEVPGMKFPEICWVGVVLCPADAEDDKASSFLLLMLCEHA